MVRYSKYLSCTLHLGIGAFNLVRADALRDGWLLESRPLRVYFLDLRYRVWRVQSEFLQLHCFWLSLKERQALAASRSVGYLIAATSAAIMITASTNTITPAITPVSFAYEKGAVP